MFVNLLEGEKKNYVFSVLLKANLGQSSETKNILKLNSRAGFFFPCFLKQVKIPFQRSVSENSLVAMDFSGQIGRVIENPAEAQSAALEEGHAWRVAIFSSFLFLY